MTKAEFINALSKKLKLIRTEQGYSQEKLAEILSISKKTLVEIEKGRSSLGWCGAVTVAVIFEDSEIINMILGGDTPETIKSLAFDHYEHLPKTMGGKVWWRDIKTEKNYKIQQNIVSMHFRILTETDQRICCSFDEKYIYNRFSELITQKR